MPELRPPFGFGFAGLHRKLRERLEEIEAEIDGIVLGEVSAETLTIDSNRYTADNVADALDEIAGTSRTTETAKSAYDLANGKYALPSGGIPASDMHTNVQGALTAAGTALQGIEAGSITTTELDSYVNDSLALADSAYQLPITGIPETDIDTDVTSRLPRFGVVTLTGDDFDGPPTVVLFGGPTTANVTSDNDETFVLTNGMNSKITIDGAAQRTATFSALPGYERSGESPMANLSAETDTKLKLDVDGDGEETITLDWSGCTTALLTATQMQTEFQVAFHNTLVVVAPQTWELNTASANGGTFTATVGGVASVAHNWNADAGDVQTDFRAKWGSDDITVTHAGTTFTIKFGETFTRARGHAGATANLASITYPSGENDATFTNVVPSPFRYMVLSPTFGTDSEVVIDRADDLDVCDELKLGPAGGNKAAGSGDFADISMATADEIVDVLDTALTADPVVVANASGFVSLTTTNTGPSATIAIDASGTSNAALGWDEAKNAQGVNGLGYATNMADASYVVVAQVEGVSPTAFAVRVHDKAVGQFELTPIDSDGATPSGIEAATDDVSVVIYGTPASS